MSEEEKYYDRILQSGYRLVRIRCGNVMHLNHTLSKSLTIEFLILIFSNLIRQRCFSLNGPFLLGRLFSFEVLYVKAT